MPAKYIVVQYSEHVEQMIVFNPTQNHKDMAHNFLMGPPGDCERVYPKIVSAGVIGFWAEKDGTVKPHCSGESITLGVRSRREEDDRLANIQILAEWV